MAESVVDAFGPLLDNHIAFIHALRAGFLAGIKAVQTRNKKY